MSDILDLHLEHFVKVKVKRIKNQATEEAASTWNNNNCECFSFDPQTTNYNIFRNLLARLFHIDGEFSVSFKKDKVYIPLTSDWDLDGAISEASKPYLSISIELQQIDKTLEEWDIICPADIPIMEKEVYRCSEDRKSLAGSILSQMETALCKVQRAFSFDTDRDESLGNALMDEAEYLNMLDKKGRVVNPYKLHKTVFRGGMVPSLRPEVWQHLLNVYPSNLTSEERNIYMNSKCEEYYHLRYRWQHLVQSGTIPDVLQNIITMIKKDVRRTDRTEKFYSGSDDSENVRALFNILTTYAVNHPNVSYCQGMSDLLSPILYVFQKESVAYVCFCALMRRIHTNFRLDGRSMKLKFRHLQKMMRFYDQELYLYLKEQDALDFLFCYRWLLLELKREFPYSEMLKMMEIIWASLPPKPPHKGLELYDVKFPTSAICNSLRNRAKSQDYLKPNECYFGSSRNSFSQSFLSNEDDNKIKEWENRVRRESMAILNDTSGEEEINLPIHYRKRKFRQYIMGKLITLNSVNTELSIRSCKVPRRKISQHFEICQSWSCGEVFEEKKEVTDALYDAREFLRNQWCYSNTINEIQLNNYLNGRQDYFRENMAGGKDSDSVSNNRQRHGSNDSNYGTISDDMSDVEELSQKSSPSLARRSQSDGYMSDGESKETTLAEEEDDDYETDDEVYDFESDEDDDNDFLDSMAGQQYEEVQTYFDRKKEMLPPPQILGDGNPFLLFLCIAIIRSHRDEILRRRLDFNELGIYFDKFVRKHRLPKILIQAQKMFREYLNMGWDLQDNGEISDDPDE